MPRNSTAVAVLTLLLLSAAALAGTASALSVTVAEGDADITVEVTESGEPVRGANVTVSGVTGETPLDGEYTTDASGRVKFSGEQTSELSGVVHLRVTVDSGRSYKSVLTTFTRGPEAGSSPIGHRMSMSLQEPVASTHGKILGRLGTSETNTTVRAAADSVDTLLANLSNTEFRREVLGRDLAAGEISPSEFYLRAVKNARRSSTLRGALAEYVGYLNGHSDERLRESGVDVEAYTSLRNELTEGRSVNTDRRILGAE